MLLYVAFYSGDGTQNRIHFTGKRTACIDSRLNTQMLMVAVQVLQSPLDVARQGAYISCASYEFSE